MKYIVEILQQFTMEQRFLVLIVLLVFISGTYIITSYLKSPQKSCHDLMELNQKYVQDFVNISDMIRKMRIVEVKEQYDSTVQAEAEYEPDYGIGGNEVRPDSIMIDIKEDKTEKVFDSILEITDNNLNTKK